MSDDGGAGVDWTLILMAAEVGPVEAAKPPPLDVLTGRHFVHPPTAAGESIFKHTLAHKHYPW